MDQAYRNYRAGMIHRINAVDLGIPENTVKSWCMRYRWKERLEAEKSVHLFMKRLQRMYA